jgi:O-acetyl-ADP-ribose deacetylase (regulator of RNase III)
MKRFINKDLKNQCEDIIDKNGPMNPGHVEFTKNTLHHYKYIIHSVFPIWRGGNNNE